MKLKISIIIFLIFSVSLVAVSQYDGQYIKKEITYTLNPDGSWVKNYHHLLKYNSYYTIRRMGETFIIYNPRYQKLKVIKSETTMKDGKKVILPKNALNEILPFVAHNYPDFSNLRQMVITHTGLERGAVVDLNYQITTRSDFMPYFSSYEFIEDRLPTDHLIIRFIIPDSIDLKYKIYKLNNKPEIEKDNEKKIYTFSFENLKAFIYEPYIKFQDAPHIIFSTASNWASVFPKTEKTQQMHARLLKEIEKVKKSASNENEFCFGVQNIVAQDIDNCRIGVGLTGINIRDINQIYLSNYGTKLEKAYLLNQIFKKFDISSEILAVPFNKHIIDAVPTIFQIEDYLIKIKDNGTIYLNPCKVQNNLFPYKLSGSHVYNISRGELENIRAYTWNDSKIEISGKIKIGKEKSNGEFFISIKGNFNKYKSAVKNNKSFLKRTLANILSVSKLDVKKILLLTPEELKAEVKIEGKILKELCKDKFKIKKFNFPYLSKNMVYQKRRNNVLYLDVPFQFLVDIDIEFPKEFEVDFIASKVSLENNLGFYEQNVNKKRAGNIKVKLAVGVNKSRIESQEYSMFKDILDNYYIREPLIIFNKR